ncbi:MAG: DNA topoisomerase 4 subunit A [Clostridia bacterium]|nr:DNA topoisomerase 4 subunit A [Clostridia bacterium]
MKTKKQTQASPKNSIIFKTLNTVLHESMIPYTEHVVMDRALPRVEDGLKPVQRRILYSMFELGVMPDKPYRKSARIVGDCMGKYHPHGDSSVYDAMVRMAQNFVLKAPLIDGHGNFGSIDGDSAAAMRYTEARLAPLALELLKDLEKNTVDWTLNFDDTLKEPVTLPGRFPNLLVNGATGIAVGVATNIPPHNLSEVLDGVCAYIKNPKISLTNMMKYIKAPDFPTGGNIIVGNGLRDAYATGKGKIVIQAKTHIEKTGDKSAIVITEIPYQVNKAQLLQKIAELKEKEKNLLSYIGEITDETDRNGLRAVIKIKKGGNAKAILNYLLKNTNLQQNYNINMVAIAGGKPKLMGLLDIIAYYSDYQIQVIVRRTKHLLDEAEDRAHIVEGLLVAIKNIDDIIKIIKTSPTTAVAKERIMKKFKLSDRQAQAILDMRISRLVNMEVKKLQEEFKELKEKIKNYKAILGSKTMQEDILVKELKDVRKTFGAGRRSSLEVEKEEKQTEIFDLVECDEFFETNYVALSADHRLKRINAQKASQVKYQSYAEPYEISTDAIKINDNEAFFVFTNKGNCIKLKVKELPLGQWKSKGQLLSELMKNILYSEYPVKILPIKEGKNQSIIIYTKAGNAKITPVSDFISSRVMFSVINLKDKDTVINAEYNDENQHIIAVTKWAYSLKFDKKELPVQKRASSGTKIFKLQEGDELVFAGLTQKTGSLTILTNQGNGKKVPIGDYEITPKYRRGLKTINLKSTREYVMFAKFSAGNFDIVMETKEKLVVFGTEKLKFETRIAKGKQIEKLRFKNVYAAVDKSSL